MNKCWECPTCMTTFDGEKLIGLIRRFEQMVSYYADSLSCDYPMTKRDQALYILRDIKSVYLNNRPPSKMMESQIIKENEINE